MNREGIKLLQDLDCVRVSIQTVSGKHDRSILDCVDRCENIAQTTKVSISSAEISRKEK
jgi:hypothetical protein